jgi:osmotically inducible lipoprotein OsmB
MKRGGYMNKAQHTIFGAFALAIVLGVGGCAGMSEQDRGTAIGAGVGAVGGAVLGGGTLGTLGGAAVGGVIGHEVTKPKQ